MKEFSPCLEDGSEDNPEDGFEDVSCRTGSWVPLGILLGEAIEFDVGNSVGLKVGLAVGLAVYTSTVISF